MSNIGVSCTTLADPRAAAGQLVREARAGLRERPTLAILFATAAYDPPALVRGGSARAGWVRGWGGVGGLGGGAQFMGGGPPFPARPR